MRTTPYARRLRCALTAVLFSGLSQAQTLPSPPASPAPVVNYEYDAQGNPTKTIQAPGVSGFAFTTQAAYDKLSRVTSSTNAKSGVTQFGYNGREDLTQVTDPRSLVTQYPRNGLGDATSLVSPDTGTASQTYDAAGNLLTRTDSRGVLATYSYDALNRLTGIVYSQSGQISLSSTWTYDQTGTGYSNGIARLTSTSHPSGSTQYTYDPQGRLLTDTQRVNAASGANSTQLSTSVGYTYDSAGHVTGILYPSGRQLSVTYTGGQPTSLVLAPNSSTSATALISAIQWEPFGAAKSWQWQMGSGTQAYERVYDAYGRLVRYRMGNTIRDLTYDAGDRITAYTHYDATTAAATPALDQGFGYDELGRLTSITTASSSWSIGYDANGNRTGVTLNGTLSAYTTATTSNRLTSITNPARSFGYDSAGNTTSDSLNYTSTYDLVGRLATLTKAGVTATYSVDAQGRRVRKFTSAGAASTVVFVYDQNGQLLGEYDSTGAALREYVWLGSTPVAVFTPDPANSSNPPLVYYFHTDHLNTPRLVADTGNSVRWRWLAEPFGTTAPETDPSSLGAFTQNLRFPGQYADLESGLSYNFFRDFDGSTGRYAQSDPIGLAGGVNTYAYVNGQPTRFSDPLGLWSTEAHNYFLRQMFPGIDPAMLGALEAGSAAADGMKYQDAEHVYMHAMSSDSVSPAESRKRMCQFIKDKRALYQTYAQHGLPYSAFFEMGMALHPVMDSTSPAHRGFQRWRYRDAGNHGGNLPGMPSMEDVDTAPKYLNETLQLMQKAFNGQLDCDCL